MFVDFLKNNEFHNDLQEDRSESGDNHNTTAEDDENNIQEVAALEIIRQNTQVKKRRENESDNRNGEATKYILRRLFTKIIKKGY